MSRINTWTEAEINVLVTLANSGKDDKDISLVIGRSLAAVTRQLQILRNNKIITHTHNRSQRSPNGDRSQKKTIFISNVNIMIERINSTSLNELSNNIHQDNVARGFYDQPNEIGTQLMLVTSELSEALEADRRGKHVAIFEYNNALEEAYNKYGKEYADDHMADIFRMYVKDTFEDEIADTFIRLFDIVGWLGIDIESHLSAKLAYNRTRGYKHGKNY